MSYMSSCIELDTGRVGGLIPTFLYQDFMANTQNLLILDLRFEKVTASFFSDFVDGDRDKMLLCPV